MRRYQRKKFVGRGGDRRFFAICGVFAILIAFSFFINRRLKPVSFELAKSYGSKAVADVMNEAVSELFETSDIGYSDLVRLRYNTGGFVTSMEYNSAAINRIKTECLKILSERLSKLRSAKFKVPVGSLTGDISFSGKGPAVSVKISETAVPEIEMLSTFESVGLNQSRHEIRMSVSAKVSVYIPPKIYDFTVSQDYVLAQTVIVGEVPDGYLPVE